MLIVGGVIIILLILLTFLATVDMAFGQLSDVGLLRLKTEAEEHPSDTTFFAEVLDNRPRFRFTVGAAVQVLLVAVTALITFAATRWLAGWRHLAAAMLAALFLAGVFRQILPRFITVRNPEKVLLRLLPFVRPFYRLLVFLADPFNRLVERYKGNDETLVANRSEDEDETDEDDLQALIDAGTEEGILEGQQGELIHTIINFGDTLVNEVMTPRTDIVALPVTASVREARDAMLESKYSRLPVYKEQIDNVEGIIYVRDLLELWRQGREDENIEPLLRPVYFVPETKPVAELLEEMKKARVQLAMIVDEYGGVAGLVTTEDILEELVGEIEDEDTGDEEDEIIEIIEGGEGYYDVLGSTEIGKIERLFDTEIEDDDFTTIAGLVIAELGLVPRPPVRFTLRGLDIEILQADEKRIEKLRLRHPPKNATADEPSDRN